MLQITNLTLSFGTQKVFDEAQFKIGKKERVGLVGRNGSGKTTLFKLLTGEIETEDDSISLPKNYSIGYLKQHLGFTEDTVLEEACLGLREEDYGQEWKAEKILFGIGFTEEDLYRSPLEFSGGYQVRLNLAKVLLSEPDLLLLDEPTNYLDIVSIRWLTGFLKKWPHELIIITHDRAIMNSVTTHTMLLHRQKIKKIKGDTVKLYEQVAEEEEIYERTMVNEQKSRKKTEIFINRFRAKANLASLVQSRIKELERKGVKEKLSKIQTLDFRFNSAEFKAKNLMKVDNISFGYTPELKLINKLSITIHKDDRIGIIGKNGKGKSTLLRLLAGKLEPNEGTISYHDNCSRGYFGQTNIEQLSPNSSILEELESTRGNLTNSEVRSTAGAMLFSGGLALKKISLLSGGEKSRVSLGKILLTPTNFLLLDEPTNHLDMESCDSLLAAMDDFSGAVAIVTHNELLLHHLAKRLIIFNDNKVFLFDGTYQMFLKTIGWKD